MQNLYAFILGVIEGLTEFLPVSSTGHMILTMSVLNIEFNDFWRAFLIIIQLGSILAVLFVFWKKITQGFELWLKLFIAFFPTALIAFLLSSFIQYIFHPFVVIFMLIFGGIVFILIEKAHKNKLYTINELESIGFKEAFCIGLIQSLALIPGTSRSGASIIGGLLFGLNRKIAAEFSFLLALPTMLAATTYSFYKEFYLFTHFEYLLPLFIGFITAFFVAFFVIHLFLKFIARFTFIYFGIYRIILGFLFLILFMSGVLSADDFVI